jgi:3-hydroxyacyl-CoA dehydrogenase
MMISGKPVKADKALAMGLVDNVVEEDLLSSAVAWAGSLIDDNAPLRKIRDITIDPESVPAEFYDQFRASVARQVRGYFAPEKIIAAVQAAVELEFDEGLVRESKLFWDCMMSPESEALRSCSGTA